MEESLVCEVCDAEFTVSSEDEDLSVEYCPACGSLLFEEDAIEELEDPEDSDGW
jgi:hypothetical protein